MPPLPHVSGKTVAKALERCGWKFRKQNGSHMIYKHENYPLLVTIPNHKEVAPGTLKNIINKANLTASEFIDLL